MTKTECNGIWVYAEQHNGTLESTPFELLAKAQELKAVLHEEITAVVAGSDISALADALIAHGADKVLLLDHANLAAYSARPYQEVLAAAAQKYKPPSSFSRLPRRQRCRSARDVPARYRPDGGCGGSWL